MNVPGGSNEKLEEESHPVLYRPYHHALYLIELEVRLRALPCGGCWISVCRAPVRRPGRVCFSLARGTRAKDECGKRRIPIKSWFRPRRHVANLAFDLELPRTVSTWFSKLKYTSQTSQPRNLARMCGGCKSLPAIAVLCSGRSAKWSKRPMTHGRTPSICVSAANQIFQPTVLPSVYVALRVYQAPAVTTNTSNPTLSIHISNNMTISLNKSSPDSAHVPYTKPTPANASSYQPTHPGLLKVVLQQGQGSDGQDTYASFLVAEQVRLWALYQTVSRTNPVSNCFRTSPPTLSSHK
jgi:hypothetical protein